ncbi:hypothetical protein [Nonlabens sp. Asnod2-A12]|uniref:hypothetical protein n=1 Tax=Nonlabens sp. Asnod2-A12 TaxID=3160578 RepID=UPI00386A1B65
MSNLTKLSIAFFIVLFYPALCQAQKTLDSLFYKIPLESSRDSIYSYLKNSQFKSFSKNETILSNGKEIKIYSGYKTNKNSLSDYQELYLSSGTSSVEGGKFINNLLTIKTLYYFPTKANASAFYKDKTEYLRDIFSNPSYFYTMRENDINTGFYNRFINEKNNIEVLLKYQNKDGEIVVELEYQRHEGKPTLQKKYRPKESLITEKLDRKDVYEILTVSEIPKTTKCFTKNDNSILCLRKSIANQVNRDLDIYKFLQGDQRKKVNLSFIIKSNGQLINIKVQHQNKDLVEAIKHSINKITIEEPAYKDGKAVNFYHSMSLTYIIQH